MSSRRAASCDLRGQGTRLVEMQAGGSGITTGCSPCTSSAGAGTSHCAGPSGLLKLIAGTPKQDNCTEVAHATVHVAMCPASGGRAASRGRQA